MGDRFDDIPDEDLIPEWHKITKCTGTLNYTEGHGWQCSLETQCPMMQQVMRFHSERN